MKGLYTNPTYSTEEAQYETEITELYGSLKISHSAGTVSKVVESTITPDWGAPPDIPLRIVFPGQTNTLDNSWTRSGMKFDDVAFTSLEYMYWDTAIEGYSSLVDAQITNTLPRTMLVECWSFDSAKDDDVLYDMIEVPPFKGRPFQLAGVAKEMDEANKAYLALRVYLYNEDYADNYAKIDTTNDFIILGVGDTMRGTSVKMGPTIFLNNYNAIDRYGVAIAAGGGLASAAMQQYGYLTERTDIERAATAAGIEVAELAGIIAYGLFNNWVTWAQVVELIIPTVAAGLTAGAVAYAASRYGGKYGGLLASAASGGIAAGGAMALLSVIDNVTIDLVC